MGEQKVQTAASKGASPTPGEPPPPALGAPHQAARKVSQGRRSKEGQKIRDGGGTMGHLLSPTQAPLPGEVITVIWGGASMPAERRLLGMAQDRGTTSTP